MDFHQSFKKCSIFTPDIRKQPQHLLRISLNGILKWNEVWPLEGAMYISLWENSRGHPDNVSFMQFSTKIDGFEQKDSQGIENSYNSYEQYPLEKFFIFTIYQNYTLALINTKKMFDPSKAQQCVELVRTYFALECINVIRNMLQWNLFITRSLGPWKLPCISGFSLYQGKNTKKYKELGPAKLPHYKRILLYPTSL